MTPKIQYIIGIFSTTVRPENYRRYAFRLTETDSGAAMEGRISSDSIRAALHRLDVNPETVYFYEVPMKERDFNRLTLSMPDVGGNPVTIAEFIKRGGVKVAAL